jgi:hypothetical protein
VNDDLCIQIQVDPFGSTIDENGNYLDWPGMEDDKFQSLLINYGESRAVKTKLKTKNIIYNLLRKDDLDSIVAIYKTDDMKDLIRVILAQIVCDKNYDRNLRRRGLNKLEKIKAINFYVLKKWVIDGSPELIIKAAWLSNAKLIASVEHCYIYEKYVNVVCHDDTDSN